ncbi:MAG: undecaprenyl-diphosphate phosphatase [Bacteroides sp.]|nr:undecaprenyl-diphosphate phosphatase [Roseburia sp.]MCM1346751.1 undecaprenyl-diphosphate phosphatase [Bacteroides sp.]MCM1421312.1 undecaprenyl-diphosphate phosphatase [Bacteroides sp.]
MNWLQALLMGIFQGLTEYLPVSSSGHLALAAELLGVEDPEKIMAFTIAVHVATVLSTLVILWREIEWLFKGLFKFGDRIKPSPYGIRALNEEQNYMLNIIVSMIPIGIVGFCFKDAIEGYFNSLMVVGVCLLVTAALLSFSYFARPRTKKHITMFDAFVIGIAQSIAVLPGLSRSGSTIGTGLLLGNNKEKLAQFSFLMVIPPILGEALLDVLKAAKEGMETVMNGISAGVLLTGFVAAFVTGCIACKLMINLVKKGKMIYFAIYCAIVGCATIIWQLVA